MFKKMNNRSKIEAWVLQFMLGYDGEIHQRELARRTKVSAGAANSILKRLVKERLVEKRAVGNMVFYKLNMDSPTVKQLKVTQTVEFLEKEILPKIKPFCQKIILFGSCATGTNTEESDIDLFVLSKEKEKVFQTLGRYPRISPVVLDIVEYADMAEKDKPLYERINRGMVMWEVLHGH